MTTECNMCRTYEALEHTSGDFHDAYMDHWYHDHLPNAQGQSVRIARIRRGRWIMIPSEWRGRTTDPSTIRKRQSKHPKKLRRINNTGERLARNELRAPTAEEWE